MLRQSMKRFRARMATRIAVIFLVGAMTHLVCQSETTKAAVNHLPFAPGEKLTFQVRWSFIPAGKVVLQILPIETLDGLTAYHFVMTARTYPLVDIFYKVRDRIDSYTDTQMTRSLLYQEQSTGRRPKDVTVTFNWKKGEVQYSNFGEKRPPIPLLSGAFDPLSIFYAFRLSDLSKNTRLEAPVSDGKKCVVGRATVIKRETVFLVSGAYDTYLVEPELRHIGGVFEKSPSAKMKIWVTADEKRIPVIIKSKVKVGSFVAELMPPGHDDPKDVWSRDTTATRAKEGVMIRYRAATEMSGDNKSGCLSFPAEHTRYRLNAAAN
jgi:hypothetical protein